MGDAITQDSGRRGLLLRQLYGQHRHWRFTDDRLRDASDKIVVQPGPAVGSHYDEVRGNFRDGVDALGSRWN